MKAREIFCLASGPSLTEKQIESVRTWRNTGKDRAVIAVNNTWEKAPWADVLYAMDGRWWRAYGSFVADSFLGRKYTSGYAVNGVDQVPLCNYGNSGSGALMLAKLLGAKWIGMLGYDCRDHNGKIHHHPDHPEGMNNGIKMEKWPDQFQTAARNLKDIEVVNFTPETALECFPKQELYQWLTA